MLENPTLRMSDQVSQDVGIKQVLIDHRAPKYDAIKKN